MFAFADFDALLDDVVAISVLHHLVEGAVHVLHAVFVVVQQDLIDNFFAVLLAAVLQALLHHVAGELVVAQVYHVALYAPHYLVLVFLVFPVLQHVLNHVVPELVISQVRNLCQDLV